MQLGEMYVNISARDREFTRALEMTHKAFLNHSRMMERKAKDAARRQFAPFTAAAQRAGGALKNVLAVGAAAAAGGVALTLHKAVMEASALGETTSKLGVVFGRETKVVTAAADEMAGRFGVVRRTYMDAAAGFGLIAKASGLSKREAAALGKQFSDLSLDVSSFFNVPLDEALMAIRSGLVGEAEPMRRFGVLLNEAAVKAEALRLGLHRGKGELSEGAKVQARASLITRGLTDAHGDLARTSGSLANRLRSLQGQWLNMLATMGERLMPVAQALTGALSQVMRDAGGSFTSNKAAIQSWADWTARQVRRAGVVWREWGTYLQIAKEKAKEKLGQIKEVFKRLPTFLGNVLNSFGDYLVKLFTTIGENAANALFSGIGGALGNNKLADALGNVPQFAGLIGAAKGMANLPQKPMPKLADSFTDDKLYEGLKDGLLGNLPNRDAEIAPLLARIDAKLAQIRDQAAKAGAKPSIKGAFEAAGRGIKGALSGKGSAKAEVAARNKALGLTGGPELSGKQAERVAAYRRRQAAIKEAKEKDRAQKSLAKSSGSGVATGAGNLAARALKGAGFGDKIAQAARVAAAGAVGGVHGAAAAAGVVGQTGKKKPTRGRRGRPKAKEGDGPFESEMFSIEGFGRSLQTAALSRSAEDIASRTAKATEATAKELGPNGKMIQLLEKIANGAKPAVAG